MPQKKMIDRDTIPYKKIDKSIVEVKSCLQAELVLKRPLSPKEAHMLRSYCKFLITDDLQKITLSTKNSWKGLLMALLTIAYGRYDNDFPATMRKENQYILTQVSFHYTELISVLGHFDIMHETDDRIEQVVAPPSWRPCYVTSLHNYDSSCVERSLRNFISLLAIDENKSMIATQFASNQNYKTFSALPNQDKNAPRLWKCTTCAEGLCCVDEQLMDSLYGNRLLMVAKDLLEIVNFPEIVEIYDDYGHPAPLWGYIISEETITYLCSLFPYLKNKFLYYLYKYETPWYVIFDREYRGKWG